MKKQFLLGLASCAGLFAGTLKAETATWISNDNNPGWAASANWQGGYMPKSGDNVDMSILPGVIGVDAGVYRQNISYAPAATFDVGRIVSGPGRRVTVTVGNGKTFGVADPNDFLGVWTFLMQYAVNLNAAEGQDFVLQRMRTTGGAYLTVPTAGAKAKVAKLIGGGSLMKKGVGTLALGPNAGAKGNVLFQDAGGIELEGAAQVTEDELSAVFARAAFHVDANAADSFEYNGEDRITKWKDVRGAGYPYASQLRQNNVNFSLPWRTVDFSQGNAVVDFGNYQSSAASAEQDSDCCALKWNVSFPSVCEAFIVVCDSANGSPKSPVFCCTQSKVFFRGNGGELVALDSQKMQSGSSAGMDTTWARDGDFTVNGISIRPDEAVDLSGAPKLVTFTVRAEGKPVPMDSFAAQYGQYTGGLRIGEAVYFTNLLTAAERQAVNLSLRRKWNVTDENWDLTALRSASGAAAVSVPTGNVASVREIQTLGTTLTKAGAGTLELGYLHDAGSKTVSVESGALKFVAHAVPSADPQPAANPYRHFDADDATSIVTNEAGKMVEWKDQSGDPAKSAKRIGMTNQNPSRELGYPSYLAGACNGNAVVDFGPYATLSSAADELLAKASTMMFCPATETTSGNVREGFLLVCKNSYLADSQSSAAFLFGPNTTSPLDFYTGSGAYLRRENGSVHLHGGVWTRNGLPVHTQDINPNWLEYQVLRFSSEELVRAHGFCEDRNVSLMGAGGMIFGEVLLYNRRLTEQERLDTEAYLMRKWLKKDHPLAASATELNEVTVADGAKIGGDIPVSIKKLTQGGTKLATVGTGTLTVESMTAEGLNEVCVENGTLVLPLGGDDLTAPAFRYDASDTAGMTLNGTDVLDWQDAERTGGHAVSMKGESYSSGGNTYIPGGKHPQLVDVTINGRIRKAVDFGQYIGSGNAHDPANADTAWMRIYTSGTTKFSTAMKEVLAVELTKANNVFTFMNETWYNFHRGGDNMFRYAWATDAKPDAMLVWLNHSYLNVNGEVVDMKVGMSNDTWYRLDFAALGDTANDVLHVNTFGRDRTSNFGGVVIAEQLGFETVLSDAERAFWQNYLNWKWFGVGEEPIRMGPEIAKLTIGKGGRVTPVCATRHGIRAAYPVVDLEGSGTLDTSAFVSGSITAKDSLTVTGDLTLEDGVGLLLGISQTGADKLVVNGKLSSEGVVSVSLGVTGARPKPGTYVLAQAGSLAVDLAQWTLDAPEITARYGYRFEQNASGEIVLVIEPSGMTLFIR